LKQIKFLLIVLCSLFTAELSFAAKNSKQIEVSEYGKDVAKSVSLLLKNSKNVKSFMGNFKGYYSSNDIRNTSKLLLSKGVSQKSKIPSFVRKGSRIVFNKTNYIDFISQNLIVVNGLKVRKSQGNYQLNVASIIKNMEATQKLSFFQRLFFSEAQALTSMQGVIAAIAGGAVGALGGERYLGLTQVQGAALGVGAVYLLAEITQSSRDGDVSCTPNGNYEIRAKGRGALFMASAEYSRVSASTLSAANLPATCTENRAEELQARLGSGDIGSSPVIETNTGTSGSIF